MHILFILKMWNCIFLKLKIEMYTDYVAMSWLLIIQVFFNFACESEKYVYKWK